MGNSFRNAGIAMLVAGSLLKRPPVTIFGAFLLGVALLARLLAYLSLGDVTYRRALSSAVAFPGDTLDLAITVENKKPLPISIVCDDELPQAVEVSAPPYSGTMRPGRTQMRNEMYLGGFETVTRKYTLSCQERGLYSLGPVRLSSGDPFGLYPSLKTVDHAQRLTVYPRVLPVEATPGRNLFPFGTARGPSWIFEDPAMLKMVREYAPGDPRRHIDWKATARSGKLQSKAFEATFGRKIVVCLDLSTSRAPWEGVDRDRFESLVVTAASLCSHFASNGFSVGLVSNGISQSGTGTGLAQCPPAAGDSHLASVLSCLAALNYYAFGTVLAACRRPWVTSAGSFPVVVTGIVDDTTLDLAGSLTRNTRRGAVVVVDPGTRPASLEEGALARLTATRGLRVVKAELEGGWDRAGLLKVSPLE